MHQHILAAACNTGTAWQKFVCAHPDKNTPAGHAGFETGRAMGPVILGLIVLFVIWALTRRRSGSPATS